MMIYFGVYSTRCSTVVSLSLGRVISITISGLPWDDVFMLTKKEYMKKMMAGTDEMWMWKE